MPAYAHHGDAGFDLCSAEEILIKPKDRVVVPTGLAMEIPHGFVGLIWDKSGLSVKHGLKVLGGVVDCGYRGEVKVCVINLSTEEYKIEKGRKIAQMLVQKIERVEFEETKSLSETSRGDGGFGSTGK